IFRRRLVVCATIDDCNFTSPLSHHFWSDGAQTARVFFHVAIGELIPLFHRETYAVRWPAQLTVFERVGCVAIRPTDARSPFDRAPDSFDPPRVCPLTSHRMPALSRRGAEKCGVN